MANKITVQIGTERKVGMKVYEILICTTLGVLIGMFWQHAYELRKPPVKVQAVKVIPYTWKSKKDVKVYAGHWRKGGYLEGTK